MRLLALSLLIASAGCAAISGLNEYGAVDCVPPQCPSVESDAALALDAGETSADADTGTDAVVIEETSTVDTGAPEAPPPVCTPIAAKLVTVGAFSIDATEVTNHQYQAFLAAKGGDTSGQPATCAFNTTFVPAAGWPAAEDQCNHPVVNVDWCDAYAYCQWAGKRLCGSPTGGRANYSELDSTSASQWFAACSRAASSRFIYGTSYLPKVCVDDQYDGKAGIATTDMRLPVTSATGCRGAAAPYDALFDLNGNVKEWEDSCNDQKDGEDDCRTRGGSFREAWDKCDCDEGEARKRKQYADDLGFRCCGL